MCGIFGIVSQEEQRLGPILIEAAQRLSYCGYDSVGCATFHAGGVIDLRKDVGQVNDVAARLNLAGPILNPLLAVLPLQLLAYRLSFVPHITLRFARS
jgi:glucosamine 6-phosphate synthetase-like amidotransferase/phosphosugar isomerase protein